MKKFNNFFYNTVFTLSALFFPLLVFADGGELVEEPLWFSVLEVLGIVVAATGLYYIYKITKIQSQGALGRAFKYYGAGIISISLALIYKSIIELLWIEDGYIHELIYEGSVYLMVIMFAIGSNVAYKVLANISNIKK